jgi:hypothetical protein
MAAISPPIVTIRGVAQAPFDPFTCAWAVVLDRLTAQPDRMIAFAHASSVVFQPQELGLEMQERDRELLLKVALKVAHRKAVAGG